MNIFSEKSCVSDTGFCKFLEFNFTITSFSFSITAPFPLFLWDICICYCTSTINLIAYSCCNTLMFERASTIFLVGSKPASPALFCPQILFLLLFAKWSSKRFTRGSNTCWFCGLTIWSQQLQTQALEMLMRITISLRGQTVVKKQ